MNTLAAQPRILLDLSLGQAQAVAAALDMAKRIKLGDFTEVDALRASLSRQGAPRVEADPFGAIDESVSLVARRAHEVQCVLDKAVCDVENPQGHVYAGLTKRCTRDAAPEVRIGRDDSDMYRRMMAMLEAGGVTRDGWVVNKVRAVQEYRRLTGSTLKDAAEYMKPLCQTVISRHEAAVAAAAAAPASSGFDLGVEVTWTSQAGGHAKTKQGPIVEVVPRRKYPKSRVDGCGMSRQHESYVVRVGNKLYWPRVSALRLVAPTA